MRSAGIRYDPFGRAMASIAEDCSTSWSFFHALSTEVCDANDVVPSSPHDQTCNALEDSEANLKRIEAELKRLAAEQSAEEPVSIAVRRLEKRSASASRRCG